MQKLDIVLWMNDQRDDWSIEVNGLRHEHVSSQVVEDLVECALIVAETSLMETAGPKTRIG
jgi:hypothetical protein